MFKLVVEGTAIETWGFSLANIPVIIPSTLNRTFSDVYMYDGGMYDKAYYRSSAYIDFVFHSTNYDIMQGNIAKHIIRRILTDDSTRLWIYKSSDSSYSDGDLYLAKNATITSYDRKDDKYGRIAVRVEIEPYRYLGTDYDIGGELPLQIVNDGDITKPVIHINPIYGQATAATFTIKVSWVDLTTGWSKSNNNFVISGNVADIPRVIDVKKKYAYYYNALTEEYVSKENAVNGDYDDLIIPANSRATISLTTTTIPAGEPTKVVLGARKGYAI